MRYLHRRWIALVLVFCLLIPTLLVPGFAEEQSEAQLPEGEYTPEDKVIQDEGWVEQPLAEVSAGTEDTEQEQNPQPLADTEDENTEQEQNPQAPADTEDTEEKQEQNPDAPADTEETEQEQNPEEPLPEPEEPVEEIEEEEADRVYQWQRPDGMDRVPLMLQTDYPNVPYGDGSVATSGCTMACIAMVATYLKGEVITPDQLAKRFRNADGSHIQRMEAASIVLDLEFHKTLYAGNVVKALKQGKVVIIMVESKSDFTNTQHLMVCTEILPNGRILVNDPLGTNYRKPELEEGFTYGFTQEQLFTGFSGAWIYEFYKEPEVGPTNYPDLVLTQEEKDLLAKLIWREARGEPFKGQQAVAEVVLNRVISERFPTNDVISTIYAQDQFATAKFLDDTVADELQYKAIEKALAGPNVLPTNVYYFSRVARNSNIWGQIGNHVFCGAP